MLLARGQSALHSALQQLRLSWHLLRQGQKNLFWLQGELMALMQPQDVAVEAQVPTQLQRKLNYVFCFDKIQAMLICLIRGISAHLLTT
jgi:hypothetical protein